ncbi:hypothetical protein [Saccharothrix yanglingensis]|uniref:hypothetical protein n=1 Tax=Saccharothrix yanglingensis TaxID=659496 RepID=UPI0027D315C7|nr:hypothetical protein [Saccharothrix yanglingensis]
MTTMARSPALRRGRAALHEDGGRLAGGQHPVQLGQQAGHRLGLAAGGPRHVQLHVGAQAERAQRLVDHAGVLSAADDDGPQHRVVGQRQGHRCDLHRFGTGPREQQDFLHVVPPPPDDLPSNCPYRLSFDRIKGYCP